MRDLRRVVTLVTVLLPGTIAASALAAPPGQEGSGPEAVLEAAGLERHGFVWLSPLEAELQSHAASLDKLRRAYDDAGKQATDHRAKQERQLQPVLQALEKARQEQARLKEQLAKGNLGELANRQDTAELAALEQRVGQWNRQLADIQGPESTRRRHDLSRYVALAQAQFAAALLATEQISDQAIEHSYGPFRERTDIQAALADLGDRHRLGPQRTSYARERAKAAPLASQVLSDELPTFQHNDRWCLTTLIAERTPAVFELALDSDFSVVSAQLLSDCGIAIPAGARTISLAGEDGPITGRLVTLSSVRLGTQVIRDVPVIAIADEVDGLPPQLGRTALGDLKLKIDRETLRCQVHRRQESP